MRVYVLLTLAAVVSGQLGRRQQQQDEEEDLLSQVECEISEDGYLIPDPLQCDRYAECTPHGKLILRLCTDGYGLNLNSGKCDLISKVDCTGRDKQQAPTGTGLCPRLNGYFAVPAETSCNEFIDCREGQAFMQSCGHGAVFDELVGCVHPDETTRVGCTASEVLGFKCPPPTGDKKFGDHERFPHPTDCAYFYACLSTGQPRLLGCTRPKVFEPESGLCKDQHLVPGCEDYYPPEELETDLKVERAKIEKEIRAELEAKYGLRSGSLDNQAATPTRAPSSRGPSSRDSSSRASKSSSRSEESSSDQGASRKSSNDRAASNSRSGSSRFSRPRVVEERTNTNVDDLAEDDFEEVEEEVTTTTKKPRRAPLFNFRRG